MDHTNVNVLHLVGGDLKEGAARGAYWLHRGLLSHGVHSRILTDSKADFADNTVDSTVKNKKGKAGALLRRILEEIFPLLYPNRQNAIFSTGFFGYDFTKTEAYQKASIIHLHWINGGFVSMRHLRKIKKPIVWTLRDMWPMTGGCHYSMECEKFTATCGMCPQLQSHSKLDLSRIVFSFKRRCIPDHIKIIGISNWLSEQASKSKIFRSHEIQTISNNINTREFYPIQKSHAKSLLGLHTDKKIILTGAYSNNLTYKGFNKLIEAANNLDKNKYYLCIFGITDHAQLSKLKMDYRLLGLLHDTISLRLAYSAADVFVAPSLMEAFGKTITEAMSCGTPTACFDANGPKEIVDHKINGYRAIPFDPADLAHGIEWICDHLNSPAITKTTRQKIIHTFDEKIIASQYIDLYIQLSQQSQA